MLWDAGKGGGFLVPYLGLKIQEDEITQPLNHPHSSLTHSWVFGVGKVQQRLRGEKLLG